VRNAAGGGCISPPLYRFALLRFGLESRRETVPPIANPGEYRLVPHVLAVDAQGNPYRADVPNQMLHKLERFPIKPERH
jgi:hypothetical protein